MARAAPYGPEIHGTIPLRIAALTSISVAWNEFLSTRGGPVATAKDASKNTLFENRHITRGVGDSHTGTAAPMGDNDKLAILAYSS